MSFTAIACLLAEAIASMSEEGENPMAVGGEARHGTVAVSWKLSRLKTRTCRDFFPGYPGAPGMALLRDQPEV